MAEQWSILVRLWLQTFWHRRYVIMLVLILLPVFGFGIGILRPKNYQSSMTILIQETAKHNPFLEDFAVETRLKDRIAALEALLHSRHVLLGVAVDLNWVEKDTSQKDREDIIGVLSKALKLQLIGDELVVLQYEQRVVENIDKVLLAVAQRFMEKVLAPERSSIVNSVKFLEKQIAESSAGLVKADDALEVFMSKHAGSLPDLHSGNVKRLSELALLLSEKRASLEGAKARYDTQIVRLSQTNPVVNRIEIELVSLSAELVTLRSRYTDEHSDVQSMQRKLERLHNERSNLLASAPTLSKEEIEMTWTAAARSLPPNSGMEYLLMSQIEKLQEAKNQISGFERQMPGLQREIQHLGRIVEGFGAVEKQLRQLKSSALIKRQIHEDLSKRAEMARMTGELGKFEAPERVKIIDQPSVPTRPNGFPALIYAIFGLISSIILAVGIVAIEEISNTTIRTQTTLFQLSGLPVLARIPQLPNVLSPLGNVPEKTRIFRRIGGYLKPMLEKDKSHG
ncbi:MAG: hypothetical protein V7750_11055 [Sneathiella sp.]